MRTGSAAEPSLGISVCVGETRAQAIADTETSTTRYYRRLADALSRSVGRAGTVASEDRASMTQEPANITYEPLLRDWVVYGAPTEGTERLHHTRESMPSNGPRCYQLMGPNSQPARKTPSRLRRCCVRLG